MSIAFLYSYFTIFFSLSHFFDFSLKIKGFFCFCEEFRRFIFRMSEMINIVSRAYSIVRFSHISDRCQLATNGSVSTNSDK